MSEQSLLIERLLGPSKGNGGRPQGGKGKDRKKIERLLRLVFGERMVHPALDAFMAKKGLSQKQMADRIGISITTFLKIYQLRWLPDKGYGIGVTERRVLDGMSAALKIPTDGLFPPELVSLIGLRLAVVEAMYNSDSDPLEDDSVLCFTESVPDTMVYVPNYCRDDFAVFRDCENSFFDPFF
jgi:transcriptional regulator with XRE-family HTH domain